MEEIKEITIKQVDGGQLSFETKNFSPMEIIGLLSYYRKWMEIKMLKEEYSNEDDSQPLTITTRYTQDLKYKLTKPWLYTIDYEFNLKTK